MNDHTYIFGKMDNKKQTLTCFVTRKAQYDLLEDDRSINIDLDVKHLLVFLKTISRTTQ